MVASKTSSAQLKLDVVIIGGGIAGLATAFCLGRSGHCITIIEQTAGLENSGAGIQLAPNASRLLIRWGLRRALDDLGVIPESASFNRYENDERIGYNYIGKHVESEHGAPYYHVHRADLLEMLRKIGHEHTTVKQAKVVQVLPACGQSTSPSVVLDSGEVITADMIIGADGIKSIARHSIVDMNTTSGKVDGAVATGDMAYRATIPRELMQEDEDLRILLHNAGVTCWMGPGRHIVGYFVRGKQLYNLVMIRPEMEAVESWTAPATKTEVRESFLGWNSRVTKILALVDSVKKSKLVTRAPLATWLDQTGRIALLGDSCHAMLPYLAQGAAMAIEDAAVLGRLFSRIVDKSEIGGLLRGYEALRMPRATATQQASHANQGRFHLPDGPLQEARDAAMKVAMQATLAGTSAVQTSEESPGQVNRSIVLDHSKKLAALQFDYDAESEADKWLNNL